MISFGRQSTMLFSGNLVEITDETITHGKVINKVTHFTESVKVADDRDILTEVLKLMDAMNRGEIDLPGIQVLREKSGSLRLEKSWVERH